jgi:2-dehydro-3-deoxy-D-arabinonate dehydratase
MANTALVRFFYPDLGARIGLRIGDQVHDLNSYFPSIGAWLRTTIGRVPQAIAELETYARQSSQRFPVDIFESVPSPDQPHWLAPVDEQDIWAAGVTYERSREARQEEAIDGGDVYARVYRAERPELFFKSHGKYVVGPGGEVGIRADATWSVPEPELALIVNPALELVGFTIGNDMSSRDIEGETL